MNNNNRNIGTNSSNDSKQWFESTFAIILAIGFVLIFMLALTFCYCYLMNKHNNNHAQQNIHHVKQESTIQLSQVRSNSFHTKAQVTGNVRNVNHLNLDVSQLPQPDIMDSIIKNSGATQDAKGEGGFASQNEMNALNCESDHEGNNNIGSGDVDEILYVNDVDSGGYHQETVLLLQVVIH